jgi:hypothetical protein
VSRAVEKIVIGAGQAGGRAAANMGGHDFDDPPWFRTDQCDLNIQFTGDMCDADHLARGDPNCRESKPSRADHESPSHGLRAALK